MRGSSRRAPMPAMRASSDALLGAVVDRALVVDARLVAGAGAVAVAAEGEVVGADADAGSGPGGSRALRCRAPRSARRSRGTGAAAARSGGSARTGRAAGSDRLAVHLQVEPPDAGADDRSPSVSSVLGAALRALARQRARRAEAVGRSSSEIRRRDPAHHHPGGRALAAARAGAVEAGLEALARPRRASGPCAGPPRARPNGCGLGPAERRRRARARGRRRRCPATLAAKATISAPSGASSVQRAPAVALSSGRSGARRGRGALAVGLARRSGRSCARSERSARPAPRPGLHWAAR